MKKNVFDFLRLIRILNLLIIVATMYFFKIFLFDASLSYENMQPPLSNMQFALLTIMFVLLAAGGYALNDYYDVGMDEINKPKKNVLRNKLPLSIGINSFFIISTAAIVSGFILAYSINNITLYFFPIFICALYWFYSTKYKREFLSGNIVVAIMAALSIVLIYVYYLFAFISIGTLPILMLPYINKIVLIYSAFAFIITFIREVLKDIQDIQGDKEYGCNTIPIKIGIKKTKIILIVLSIFVGIALSFFCYFSYKLNKFYLFYYIIIFITPFWIYIIRNIYLAKTNKDFKDLSSMLKIFMLAGIFSLQLLHLSNLWK